jgi:creatinine amidohydrolase
VSQPENVLADLTWPEAAAALQRARIALLPIGSCEQHGRHLPFDTDAAVADELARRLARRLADLAVLCPTVGYGLSEHHLGFAGTLTLRPNTLLAVLADLLESLHHAGLQRVLVINGHGGNIDAINLAARTARRDHGMLVASAMWAVLGADVVAETAAGSSFGHACETETSVALALFGDRVRLDRLEAPSPRRSVDPLTDAPGATVQEPVWLHEWSEDGALGDPARADRAAGERIVEVVLDRAEAFARRLADRALPEETT